MALAEYLRIIDKTLLQTAVRHYEHPETGRRVTLVATAHVGDSSYYVQLRELIDERESDGAVVHSEGSGLVPFDDSGITEDEELLLCALRACAILEADAITAAGWVYQTAWLRARPGWKIHDLSDLDIIRGVGLSTIERVADQKRRMFAPPKGRIGRKILRFKIGFGLYMMAGLAVKQRRGPGHDILVDARNEVALDAFRAIGLDTVLVWGAAHGPGLDAGIRDAGLTYTGTDWLTVTDLPGVRQLLRNPTTNPAPRPEMAAATGRAPSRDPRIPADQ